MFKRCHAASCQKNHCKVKVNTRPSSRQNKDSQPGRRQASNRKSPTAAVTTNWGSRRGSHTPRNSSRRRATCQQSPVSFSSSRAVDQQISAHKNRQHCHRHIGRQIRLSGGKESKAKTGRTGIQEIKTSPAADTNIAIWRRAQDKNIRIFVVQQKSQRQNRPSPSRRPALTILLRWGAPGIQQSVK